MSNFFCRRLLKNLSIVFLISLIYGCGTTNPYYSKELKNWQENSLPEENKLIHTIYLLGDAGEEESNPIYDFTHRMIMNERDSASSIVWLGDNIYYDGLPEPDEKDREDKEKVIKRLIGVADSTYKGNVIFVPGNHDWNESHAGGLAAVNRQEDFVEKHYNGRNVFLPSNGCPGPVEVPVNDELVIIAVDSEWWSHKYEKPRFPDNGCTVEDKIDFIIQIEDAIRRNKDKHIMLVAHHPIMSNSNHGGHFNFWDHLFPLRLVRDHLYIPLPLIGSAYPLLRKLGVTPQDIPSNEGQQWKDAILSMTSNRPNVIYSAGHDHNIQLHKYGNMHEIVSGSAAKVNFAARGFGASFVQQEIGFSRVLYYDDGQVWIEYYALDDDERPTLSLRTPLYSFKAPENKDVDFSSVPDYTDSIKTISANPNYKISKFSSVFVGKHYRKEWTTPVTVPYLDVKTFSGGITPIKKGGGKQTLTLHFMNDDSIQFVLRSVEKFPAQAIPAQFRKTWLNDFVKDQASTAHPYGALTIPKMADAIDIFYTRPKLVYTPHTPYLRQYINQFGGMLAQIEVRPDEDLSPYARFGNSENVVSTETMLRHLREDNDNEIDQKLYLKSRLFDMLIGDWDRHDDQWRWAEYEKEKGSLFKPIPRDRDQVYSKYDGVLPWLLSRKWAFRNFVTFDYEIEDVQGINMVAQNLDRMLITELTRDEWYRAALEIKYQLSDYVIESAIRDMPTEVFEYSGEEIIAKLKSRRDGIVETALDYYDFVMREVYLVTSNKHERIEITRLNADSTRVKILKTKKEGDVLKTLFERSYDQDETSEIRIFARDGNDRIFVDGNTNNGIKLKIVGGEGEDEFYINSTLQNVPNGTIIYDNEKGNIFEVNKNTKLILDDALWVNEFKRDLYRPNYFGPRFTFNYNIDQGIELGAGIRHNRNGFKAEPYKSSYYLMAFHSFNLNSTRFIFQSQFYNTLGHDWDIRLLANYFGPRYVFNYFGYGNDSSFDLPIENYRVNMTSLLFEPSIVHRFSEVWSLGVGPSYEYFNVEDPPELPDGVTNDPFYNTSTTRYIGAKFFSEIELTEKTDNPEKGIRWYNEAAYHNEIDSDRSFTSLGSELSFYFTPNLPVHATFAFRVGTSTNIGDFYFYQSRFLGGSRNLRGYRNNRFAGRTNFYNNNELRLKVFTIRNSLITGDIGLIGFYDLGKVWADDEEHTEWNNSVGPGLYFNIYNILILSGTYGVSDESDLFNFRVGFLF